MNLKKKMTALLTSLTLVATSSCTEGNTNFDFDTDYGKRNLMDYSEFLQSNGINYRLCTAESEGNIVYVCEKQYSDYIVNADTTLVEIINNGYCIDDDQIKKFESIKAADNYNFINTVRVYSNKMYYFSLSDMDNSSKYEYHIVQPGETFESLSSSYGVPEQTLRQVNKMYGDVEPEVGSSFRIPKNSYQR